MLIFISFDILFALMPKPKEQQRIARERIEHLFREAEKIFAKDPKLSNEYVKKARKIGMRYEVPIPRQLKRKFCKHCGQFFVPGRSVRVRLHKQKVVYSCFACKKQTRFPYIKEKKEKRTKKIKLKAN
jgi:ribonuclease P protein subunit RPR2